MTTSRKLKHSNVGLPSNLLHAIGHVAALWARIEFIVDSQISEALALPGAPNSNPRLVVPFNQRLELLDMLCEQYLTDPENRVNAAKIISNLKQLVGQRNLIIHGSVSGSKQRQKRRVVYWFRRIRWDDPRRIVEKRAFTVAQVEALAMKLSDAVSYAQMIEVFFWGVERALLGKGGQ
jgi:hypothetical protein